MAETLAIAVLAFVGVEATTFAIAVTTVIIGIGVSAGVSVLTTAFMTSSNQQVPGQKPSDRQFISKNTASPRVRSYGRVRIAGAQVFLGAAGGSLWRVVAHNDGPIDAVEEHLIDDLVVTVPLGNGTVAGGTKFDGWVAVWWREGTASQTYYPELEVWFPDWDSSHVGNGVAHSLVKFVQSVQERFSELYPAGENTSYKQTIRASKIWDPRDEEQDASDPDTWGWSDNSALVVLDYMRHASGMAMPLSMIEPELADWIRAADACDEDIPLAAGGVVRRYRSWGTYSYDERPADVLARLMTACNGRTWIGPNGGMTFHVGVWVPPTITLGDDAIVSYKLGSGNEAPDTANTLTAMFVDPAQGYVEAEAEPMVDDAMVAAFGEQRADAKLYMVPGHSQCRRLMKQAFGRLSPEWKGTITTNKRGLAALSERYINIEIAELDLAITVEIDNVQFRIEKGSIVTGVILDVTSVDPAQFDWDAETEEGLPSEVPPEIESISIPPPSSFGVTIEERGSYAVGVGSWGAPPVATLRTVLQYKVEQYVDDELVGDWLEVTSTDGASSVETPALTDGETYVFHARHAGSIRSSDWTSIVTRDVVVDAVAPGVPTGLSTSKAGNDVTIAWTNPNSANTYGARVYRNTVDDAASALLVATRYGGASIGASFIDLDLGDDEFWWFVAAINGSGVEGTRTAAGNETIP